MKDLLKIELTKTVFYPTFWAILLLHTIFFFAIIILGSKLNINIHGVQIFRLFSANYIWGTIAWIASWFNLLLAILIIVLIGNELQYNTLRRQVLDGLTRNKILLAKVSLIFALSLYVVFIVILTGIAVGVTSGEPWQGNFLHGFKYVLILGIQSFAYMALAMLFVMVFRNIALTIVTFLLYFIMIEPIIRFFFPPEIDSLFPMSIISNLTPMPDFMGMLTEEFTKANAIQYSSNIELKSIPESTSFGISIPVCLFYIGLFIASSFFILKKRDL